MEADVAVGATLIVGAKRRTLVSKQMLMRMKPGSVFVYVGMDQVCGGTLWWCVAGWHRQSVSHQQNWKATWALAARAACTVHTPYLCPIYCLVLTLPCACCYRVV